jgi:hypothetical protein
MTQVCKVIRDGRELISENMKWVGALVLSLSLLWRVQQMKAGAVQVCAVTSTATVAIASAFYRGPGN